MPTLNDIADVLRKYGGRYEVLDAFADDVDELRTKTPSGTQFDPALPGVPPQLRVGGLLVQLFPDQGIARFKLAQPGAQRDNGDRIMAAGALGAVLGVALSSASKTKEGLLGGLIVGMLVGATTQQVERVLALTFDPATGGWQVYDGPLLRWAKRTLNPAAPPAA